MLNERLLDIRDEAELNQEDMAEILKVSQSNYSRWENGRELIPLSKLNILCNHFKINMDYVTIRFCNAVFCFLVFWLLRSNRY